MFGCGVDMLSLFLNKSLIFNILEILKKFKEKKFTCASSHATWAKVFS
jgi:hypothetical protein